MPMRFRKLIPFFVLLWTGIICSPGMIFAQQISHAYDSLASKVLKLINEHRTEMALKPLVMVKQISSAASVHSLNMATGKVPFGHKGFDERMDHLKDKLKPVNSFAENVAFGASTADEVVDLWLTSPGHRQNIEGDFDLTGIGIVKSKDGDLYYTQIFLRKGN